MKRSPRKHKVLRVTGGKVAYMNTSKLPDKEIERAIRFIAKETNLDRVVIHVKGGSRVGCGKAYHSIPSITNMDGLKRHEWRWLITVGAGKLTRMPDWIFDTFAHEARHIEQMRSGRIWRLKRERNCEGDARAFAHWMTAKWRTHREGAASAAPA